MDIAGARRDRVALVKKIFLVVKIVFMVVLAAIATVYLVYASYAANEIKEAQSMGEEANPTWEGFKEYLEDPHDTDPIDRMMISISYGICSFLSSAFVVFLVLHGIQVLVIKFIMRNADHG